MIDYTEHRKNKTIKNRYEINEPVKVFVKIPGSRKGYYLDGVVETEKTQGMYRVFFAYVEVAGKMGTRGWYHTSDMIPIQTKEKGEKNEYKSEE